MSDTAVNVLGIGGGLLLASLVVGGVFGLLAYQQRKLDRLNAAESAKYDHWAREHELNMLPCSNPRCSACVYGRDYCPPLRPMWVLR